MASLNQKIITILSVAVILLGTTILLVNLFSDSRQWYVPLSPMFVSGVGFVEVAVGSIVLFFQGT